VARAPPHEDNMAKTFEISHMLDTPIIIHHRGAFARTTFAFMTEHGNRGEVHFDSEMLDPVLEEYLGASEWLQRKVDAAVKDERRRNGRIMLAITLVAVGAMLWVL
jgi:hypothetical protein